MIRIGAWLTNRTINKSTSKPILTYKCSFCGNEDIAMTNTKFCGKCYELVPNIDLLFEDGDMRVLYHIYGEC